MTLQHTLAPTIVGHWRDTAASPAFKQWAYAAALLQVVPDAMVY